jgi:aminotransferase
LTVGAAAPLQAAGATALALPEAYYRNLALEYGERRDLLLAAVRKAGFTAYKPQGAYYIMTDIRAFGFANDRAFAEHLVREVGVATVPGSSFYSDPARGAQQVRFAFCKRAETLEKAIAKLAALQQ